MQHNCIYFSISKQILPIHLMDGVSVAPSGPARSTIASVANTVLTTQSAPPTLQKLSVGQHNPTSTFTAALLSFSCSRVLLPNGGPLWTLLLSGNLSYISLRFSFFIVNPENIFTPPGRRGFKPRLLKLIMDSTINPTDIMKITVSI